jgi:hypothetical protein
LHNKEEAAHVEQELRWRWRWRLMWSRRLSRRTTVRRRWVQDRGEASSRSTIG